MSEMKNLHLQVRWVYEWRYNPYQHVSEQKKRPLLVWTNKSKYLNHKMLCFYCSTKKDNFNKKSCVLIESKLNPAFDRDTYVWIHKPIVVENRDVIPLGWKHIVDQPTRDNISNKVKEIYTDLLKINF